MQYLRRDRMYTHLHIGATGLQGHSAVHFESCQDGIYPELAIHNIKTAFAVVDSLWVDLSMGTTEVVRAHAHQQRGRMTFL